MHVKESRVSVLPPLKTPSREVREDIQASVQVYRDQLKNDPPVDEKASSALDQFLANFAVPGTSRFVVKNLTAKADGMEWGDAEFVVTSLLSVANVRYILLVQPANDTAIKAMGTEGEVCMVVGMEAVDKYPSVEEPEYLERIVKEQTYTGIQFIRKGMLSGSAVEGKADFLPEKNGFVILTHEGTLVDSSETFKLVDVESKQFLATTYVRFGSAFCGSLYEMLEYHNFAQETREFIATRVIQEAAEMGQRGLCLNDISLKSVYFSPNGDPVLRSHCGGSSGEVFYLPLSFMIIAPEQAADCEAKKKPVGTDTADAYGAGAVAFKLLVDNSELNTVAPEGQLKKFRSGDKTVTPSITMFDAVTPLLEHETPSPWNKVIAILLERDPARRPTAAQVAAYFKKELIDTP